ncbi:aspartate-semialdehyde dehydrogenase [Alphaproteobacteria bacterium]|nr:aspartate-semialdehyde dehydrogenase [Alphaproteobacteria bacterium]
MTTSSATGYRIAVLGATGNVGQAILNELAHQRFPCSDIHALASTKSNGQEVAFGEDILLKVKDVDTFDFAGIDFVFASIGAPLIKQIAPRIKKSGAILIDNSSAFRMEPTVPLVVPEVNAHRLEKIKLGSGRVVANPNCVATPLAMTLKALSAVAPLEKVVVSTYQSVSGAGKEAMDALYTQAKQLLMAQPVTTEPFDRQIAFNLIPLIDDCQANGVTGEEEKVAAETFKLLETPAKVTATCVRVPVFVGHSLSVNATFKKPASLADGKKALSHFPGISFHTRHDQALSPQQIAGDDQVHVCRLRDDQTDSHGLSYWVVSDNLRKGAAQNAVQIAQTLHRQWAH